MPNISSKLRKFLLGKVEPSPEASSNKIPQDIHPQLSGTPPQAMQVQRLRVEKKIPKKDLPEAGSDKSLKNMDAQSSGPPPQAMQVQRLRVDKKTGNKDDQVSYESFKGVDASLEDLRLAKQETENRVRKLTARINTDTAELKVWEVWLNVTTAYETESRQEKLGRG